MNNIIVGNKYEGDIKKLYKVSFKNFYNVETKIINMEKLTTLIVKKYYKISNYYHNKLFAEYIIDNNIEFDLDKLLNYKEFDKEYLKIWSDWHINVLPTSNNY